MYSDALIGTGTQYIEADLFYAKAVSCTRLISILQVSIINFTMSFYNNNFVNIYVFICFYLQKNV